jgi:4-hydroxy-tetrahydrodipicolinate synthase
MCDAALQGDFDTAEKYDNTLRALHVDLFIESNPIPVKYAVSKLGFGDNHLRLPLTPVSEREIPVIEAAMRKAGLL